MKFSDLNLYYNNSLSIKDFLEIIELETSNYIEKMQKTGSSIQLHIIEDENLFIDNIRIIKLLEDIINNNYNLAILCYICDCLDLGEKIEFANPLVEEIIFDLADPEINYPSKEKIISKIDLLNQFNIKNVAK